MAGKLSGRTETCHGRGLRAAFPAIRRVWHGWCMPDMPASGGQPIYNKADAERAWGKLLALYKATLA